MSTTSPENVNAVFKAYDVRGTVPDQLDEDFARATGRAYVQVLDVTSMVIGYDMRPSSPDLAGAFADGATSAGADVTMIGLASTDQLYFASGHLGLPGAMFTASHNPAQYNGIKFCRAGAAPIGQDSGLGTIREWAERGAYDREPARVGSVSSRDVLADYAAYLHSLVDLASIRPLKVVVDAGNGMGGHTVPAVLGTAAGLPALPLEIVPMYFELDGSFPNHEANPLEPANLVDLQAAVVSSPAATRSRMSSSPVSAPTGAAWARHSLIPLYCAGLCDAVNIAPGRPHAPEAKYSPSVEHSPIRTTSTPAAATPAANASTSSGPDSRMSLPTTTVPAPSGTATTRANAAPIASATAGESWSGTVPRTSYALMMVERSVVTASERTSSGEPRPG